MRPVRQRSNHTLREKLRGQRTLLFVFCGSINFSNLVDEVQAEMVEIRSCDGFTNYLQGFSPKEHLEMENSRAAVAIQDRRENEDKRWRERQADNEKRWRERQAKKEQQRHIMNLIVFGVVGALVSIVSSWIQSGDIPLPTAIDSATPRID